MLNEIALKTLFVTKTDWYESRGWDTKPKYHIAGKERMSYKDRPKYLQARSAIPLIP